MHKPVLLATVSPYRHKDIQLALFYLKAYCLKYMPAMLPQIPIIAEVFPAHIPRIQAERIVLRKKPGIVGFSCYIWNVAKILQLARSIKKRNPSLKIVVGGPEVSVRSEALLRDEQSIDIVVRGEGEVTFFELLQSIICQRMPLSCVQGITYRDSVGNICVNRARPPIKNLDSIPSPYLEGIIQGGKDTILPTETMRGCLYRCHYCYYHKDFPKLRFFSLRRIARELRCILAHKPPEVYLMDPTFNIRRERAKDILRIFKRYNRRSKLHVELRAELLDKEMVHLLKQANATFIEIGVQSTDRRTLRRANRSFGKSIFKKNIMLLNREKLPYQLQIIDALPGHTYAKIKKSLDWLFLLRAPQVVIMKLMLLPGTFLRQHARRLGLQYDRQPPYYVQKSNTLSGRELRKIHELRYAMSVLYDTGLLRKSLDVITKKLDITFSDVFETWAKWEGRFGGPAKIERLTSRAAADTIPLFVKYLCLKYNRLRTYKDIYPAIRQDLGMYYAVESQRSIKGRSANA